MASREDREHNLQLIKNGVSGIFTPDKSKRLKYASREARYNTFADWAFQHIVAKEQLVLVGLYCIGQGDSTMCYYCGVELHSWELGDDPYKEHERNRPECRHVKAYAKEARKGISDVRAESLEHDISIDCMSALPDQADQLAVEPVVVDKTEEIKLQRENDRLRERTTCLFCLDKTRTTLFLPCGHMLYCSECAAMYQHCPECQSEISGVVETKFSSP